MNIFPFLTQFGMHSLLSALNLEGIRDLDLSSRIFISGMCMLLSFSNNSTAITNCMIYQLCSSTHLIH